MKEIWKPIKGYEKLYEVSNFGKIKSLKKKIILKQFKNTNGYFQVELWKNKKGKQFLVHKLVAESFILNINNFPFINHIDENKENNCTNNLEWCTAKYNCNYGTRNSRLSSPVICIELNKIYQLMKKLNMI